MRQRALGAGIFAATLVIAGTANAADLGQILIHAVSANDPALVSELIRLGADVGATDKNGRTALAVAAELDEPEIAVVLINSGARPWTPDRTTSPIAIAAAFGSSAVVEPLLSKGLPPVIFNDALSVAATRGDLPTVEQLIKSAKLSPADIDDLKRTLMARFKVDLNSGGDIDPRVALLALKACRDNGLYQTERCISPQMAQALRAALGEITPQECDSLAAAPTNSARPSSVKPVYLENINASKAVAACLSATTVYPKVPRFALELGRAYWAQKDYTDAIYYLRKAGDIGSAFALTELAFAYSTGGEWGVPKDEAKAARLLAKAADLGDLPGLTGLGGIYESGTGVIRDFAKALALYQVAAGRGGVDSMVSIGLMYQTGTGVMQDKSTALIWYKMAADAGFHKGINSLAFMYETGQGANKKSRRSDTIVQNCRSGRRSRRGGSSEAYRERFSASA